jgi:hypothetical protein
VGSLSLTSTSVPTCPQGHDCFSFSVACPSVATESSGYLAVAPHVGRGRGVVLLASGGTGKIWWGHGRKAPAFLQKIREAGLTVVQLRWTDAWWRSFEEAGSGEGTALLACRSATAIDWVHDQVYAPMGVNPRAGRCGYCLTGNSAGASQISYALSHYGLEAILDAVVPTNGPPHAGQPKGCLRHEGEEAYWYGSFATHIMDASYGYADGDGPCALHAPAWFPRWEEDSVEIGGSDYSHPRTRVRFILGARDTTEAPAHALDYADRLRSAGSPLVSVVHVPTMTHDLLSSAEGLAELTRTLVGRSR